MERIDIITKITPIFRKVLNNESLQLTEELTANDVEHWDSLSHMLIINEIETTLSIKFKLKELNKMSNIGDMITIIISKMTE